MVTLVHLLYLCHFDSRIEEYGTLSIQFFVVFMELKHICSVSLLLQVKVTPLERLKSHMKYDNNIVTLSSVATAKFSNKV